MGYTTKFSGRFTFDEPLTADQIVKLREFAGEDHRHPNDNGPDAYLQWVPTKDGMGLEWDGGEKFYCYTEWLEYLIERFFKPWGRVLGGRVEWDGEDRRDQGVIHVKDNRVQAIPNVITMPDPAWKIEKPEPKW